jgi:hypothetical protein
MQLVVVVQERGSGRSAQRITKILPRPSGYSVLPSEGGLLDQSYRLMTFFDMFRLGESEAFDDRLNQK